MNKDKLKVIIIAGPTAVGKTEYAIRAAEHFGGEIVSADSMQLYKFMDIGSAKPTPEEVARAKHYLVDEIDPRQDFSVSDFRELAGKYIADIASKGLIPIVSGGTGLYVNSLLYEMDFAGAPKDPQLREHLSKVLDLYGPKYLHRMLMMLDSGAGNRIHPNNSRKIIRAIEAAKSGSPLGDFSQAEEPSKDYEILLIGLNRDRQELYQRINLRVDLMMEAGLIDEVRGLMDMGLDENAISMKGIGYKEIIAFLKGQCDLETAVELVKQSSRRYAKRQLTWFRRYRRMNWIDLTGGRPEAEGEMIQLIEDFLKE